MTSPKPKYPDKVLKKLTAGKLYSMHDLREIAIELGAVEQPTLAKVLSSVTSRMNQTSDYKYFLIIKK